MSVRGAYQIQFAGPPDGLDDALQALAAAGVAAEPDRSVDVGRPEFAGLGWLIASGSDGTDHPSAQFVSAFHERATSAVSPFGYTVRSNAWVVGGPANARQVVHRPTGQVVGGMNSTTPEFDQSTLVNLAAELGVAVEDLELREIPGTWELPIS